LSARGGEGDQAWRSFLRTSLLLIGAAGAAVSAILMTAPEWIARWSGIGPERTTLVRWLAAPVVLTCALVVWSAILNARRQTGRLALVQLAAPAAMALLAYPAARAAGSGNESALLGWLAAAPACAALAALAVGASKPWWCGGGGRWWNRRDASVFLTVSGSLLAGGAAGSLALLGVRARILHQQGFAAAGEFDAA